jgi:hypothetical protein
MTDIPAEPADGSGLAAMCHWMAEKGYAIGHGETIKELLDEINRQAMERGRKAASPALILDEIVGGPTRGERSRELGTTPCCGASWVIPKTGKANDRFAVCSDCGEYSIRWEVETTVIKVTK